jgi:hypothetical protein
MNTPIGISLAAHIEPYDLDYVISDEQWPRVKDAIEKLLEGLGRLNFEVDGVSYDLIDIRFIDAERC